MKQWILFSFFFLGVHFSTNACCGEYNERYVPLGQLDEELYMLEIKFHRNCRSEGAPGMHFDNQFFIKGVVNILKYQNENFAVVDTLLNFHEIECHCIFENYTEKTNVDSLLNSYYKLALTKMEKKPSFEKATQKSIYFNDSTSYTLLETDTAVWFDYNSDRNYIYKEDSINLWKNISTQEPKLISEKRLYTTKSFNIEVIQLSSEFISQEATSRIEHRFYNGAAFWTHKSLWHGVRRDVIYLYR
ncbi:MAG: hypothetical protein WEA99_02200 [Brumimicrobium sp.]